MWALVCTPQLTQLRNRIEQLRCPQAQLLGELCGYGYQTETIRKFVSEWSVAGLSARLQHTLVREHMPQAIGWDTFIERVGLLRGRRETTAETLTIVIYGNRRDVDLMKQLTQACQSITDRRLTRKGRGLRYAIEWPDGVPDGWSD